MSDFPPGLAQHYRSHNRSAVFLALGCLLASVICWAAVYGILLWLELLFITTVQGIDAPPQISVTTHFFVVALVLLFIGSLVRRWKTQNEKFHLGIALFTVLSIPARLTYAVWDNFSARVHPSSDELAAIWQLLTILRNEKKVAITNLAARLTSDVDASRIAYLTAIVDLTDTDLYNGIYYLHLRNEKAERLVRHWTRSLTLEG